MASISSDSTDPGPRMSYTKSTDCSSLRKMKGSVFEAAATHVLGGLCTQGDMCHILGQGLHAHLTK